MATKDGIDENKKKFREAFKTRYIRQDDGSSKEDVNPTEVLDYLYEQSVKNGLNPFDIGILVYKESGFDPLVKAKGSSATGLFQITDGTWSSVTDRPIHKRGNWKDNIDVGLIITRDNIEYLKSYGITNPTMFDVYMANMLGAKGYSNFLNGNPNYNHLKNNVDKSFHSVIDSAKNDKSQYNNMASQFLQKHIDRWNNIAGDRQLASNVISTTGTENSAANVGASAKFFAQQQIQTVPNEVGQQAQTYDMLSQDDYGKMISGIYGKNEEGNYINNAIRRWYELVDKYGDNPITEGIENEDGTFSTHSVGTFESDNMHHVIPTIFREGEDYINYSDLEFGELFNKAKESGELIGSFDNQYLADFISQNYKGLENVPYEDFVERYKAFMGEKYPNIQSNDLRQAKAGGSNDLLSGGDNAPTTPEKANAGTTDEQVSGNQNQNINDFLDRAAYEEKIRKIKEMQQSIQDMYDNKMDSLSRIDKMSKAKTLFDTAANMGMLFENMRNNQIEDMPTSSVPIPSIPPLMYSQQNMLDKMTDTSYAMGMRLAREMGRPDLAPGYIANVMAQEDKSMAEISGQELQRQAQEAQLQQQAYTVNAQLEAQTNQFNIQNKAQAAAKLSEVNAKLMSNFSDIMKNHIESFATIEEQKQQAEAYKYAMEHGLSNKDFHSYLANSGGSESYTTNSGKSKTVPANKTPIYDNDRNII